MEFVGLISGGKDSIFSILKLVEQGHKPIVLANLYPPELDKDLDSYMYQSVGMEATPYIAEAMELPLMRRPITGKPLTLDLGYEPTKEDEVEDLYLLLKDVKEKYPNIKGVSSGAIKSTYQKNRVENICERLGLVSLAPIWDREQEGLLEEMVNSGMKSILARVCAPGLETKHLGKSIIELHDHLKAQKKKHYIHICGEGGEYETITLDCPLYKKEIVVEESEIVIETENQFQLVARLLLKKLSLKEKSN